ncbi:hypothetical protein Scep_004561 [Stephania cephalantha]|uniref:Uncharacterized protein n=1 Tax=Stephania cephalantha TaxID=152367 RepID=A0AAP0PVH1_9MAGN
MFRYEELKNGDGCREPPLSQPILTSNNPSLPPQISDQKLNPPPPIHRQLSISLSRPIHLQLSVSLSLKYVSQTLKSLHRLPEVGASAIAASCRRVCRRWCRLPSLPPKPSSIVVDASEAIVVCLRPLLPLPVQPPPLVATVRRCVGNHRRLPSPSAAAGCAAPAAVRRCRGNHPPLPPLAVQPPPLFVAASETIAVCLRPLPPLPVQPSPLLNHCRLKRTYKVWNASLEWPRVDIGYELRAFETNTSEMPPTVNELYLHLHTVNHDGVTFIDTRSQQFYPVDEEAVYYNVAGECPKGRVYSLGLLGRKKRRYADPGARTSQLPEMVPRSEFDSFAEQLRQVVAFMQRQFGMTIDTTCLSHPQPQPQPPPPPPPHEQQQPTQIDPADPP